MLPPDISQSTLGNSQPLKTLWFQSAPFFLYPRFSVDFLLFSLFLSENFQIPIDKPASLCGRLRLQDKQFQKSGRKDLFPAGKNRKPANKPGKGKKLPNRHPEITKIMAEEAVSRDEFPFYYEKLLHQAFRAEPLSLPYSAAL